MYPTYADNLESPIHLSVSSLLYYLFKEFNWPLLNELEQIKYVHQFSILFEGLKILKDARGRTEPALSRI